MVLWLSQIYDYSIEISYLEPAFLKKQVSTILSPSILVVLYLFVF